MTTIVYALFETQLCISNIRCKKYFYILIYILLYLYTILSMVIWKH